MQAVEISRAEITETSLVEVPAPMLASGEVRLRLEKFALTVNNVTYAVIGDTVGYWKFFPATQPARGRVPVWGTAEVVETAGEVPVGERVYGFFPMAGELIAAPGRVRDDLWIDTAIHRAELPPLYNTYIRLAGLSDHDPQSEEFMCLLYPLYATSFLLADYLSDHAWFGAEQIVVGSASSKTAIGFMQLVLEYDNAPALIGLTSPENADFVKGLGVCADVLSYATVAEGLSARPSVYVDMSGNTELRRTVHTALDDQLAHSCAVGLSHWDKIDHGVEMPGPKAEFFFAPDQVKKRREDWGPGVVEARMMAAWQRLVREHTGWLALRHHHGLGAAAEIYRNLAQGASSPSDGHIVTL